MLRRLAIFAVLLAAAATTAVVQSAPASAAGILSSNITSPANGTRYLITDVAPATTATVSGTTTGGSAGDLVDVRCYENPGQWDSFGAAVGVPIDGAGKFSVAMPTDMPYGTCILRAVPHGYSATGSLAGYTGPKVSTEYNTSTKVASGPNAGIVVDYTAEFAGQHAMNKLHSATSSGLSDARLVYPDGSSSDYLWGPSGALPVDLSFSTTRAPLRVDGNNAYGPFTASHLFPNSADTPGLPALTHSATRNATSGVITIHEIDPVVTCPAGAPYPPTAASCPKYTSAGVRIERTVVIDDGGLQVHISDVWRSTDGKAHTLSLHHWERVEGYDKSSGSSAPTSVGLKLPWLSTAYKAFSGATSFSGPTKVPASVFVREEMAAPDGNKDHPRGALTFDVAPTTVNRGDYKSLDFWTEGLTVPAGGTRLVRRDYVIGSTQSTVDAKAAASRSRLNPYRPDGSIHQSGYSSYLGNNVYSTVGTGQTTTATKHRGTTAVFYLKVQNDGTAPDTFKLKGPGGSTAFGVHYLSGSSGSWDITKAVTAGTYKMSLAPGATKVIRLVVTVRSAASIGSLKSWLITATSSHDGNRRDAVKARVRVAAS